MGLVPPPIFATKKALGRNSQGYYSEHPDGHDSLDHSGPCYVMFR